MNAREVPPESGMGGLPDEQVGGPYGPPNLSDEEMTRAVRQALLLDPTLKEEDFDVWVDHAIVYLTPHTADATKRHRARELAEAVHGVREVFGD